MPGDVDISVLFDNGYTAGWRAALDRVQEEMKIVRWRQQDLSWCSKDDDCRAQAKGVTVAIGDFELVLDSVRRLSEGA